MNEPRVTARSVRTPTGVETIYRVNGQPCTSIDAVEALQERHTER